MSKARKVVFAEIVTKVKSKMHEIRIILCKFCTSRGPKYSMLHIKLKTRCAGAATASQETPVGEMNVIGADATLVQSINQLVNHQ